VIAGDASAAAIAATGLVSRIDETTAASRGFDEDPSTDDTDDLPDVLVAAAHPQTRTTPDPREQNRAEEPE